MRFLTVSLHPVLQRTCELDRLQENQVNRCLTLRVDASGKGVNVTRVLHQLGEEVMHLTQLGGVLADYFVELTRQDELALSWVNSESEIRICTTLLSRSAHTATEIVEEAPPVSPHTDGRMRARFLQLLPGTRMVILSGSKAPGFAADILPWMVRQAKERGVQVLVDYRGRDLMDSLPSKPDLIKPNRQEFQDTFFPGCSTVPETRIMEQMIALQRSGIQVVLTNGAQPVWYVQGDRVVRRPVEAVVPVNAIGSGDAFAAGLAAVWSETGDMEAAVDKALWCGKQNARLIKPGVIRSQDEEHL
ncbi:MAG: Tagatose-6-phosphate kinase [bacterium ADurb.Bin478]|nr:MAG: Tagatose-6-phosphate kinase [bacterium ADurb.Bin478]